MASPLIVWSISSIPAPVSRCALTQLMYYPPKLWAVGTTLQRQLETSRIRMSCDLEGPKHCDLASKIFYRGIFKCTSRLMLHEICPTLAEAHSLRTMAEFPVDQMLVDCLLMACKQRMANVPQVSPWLFQFAWYRLVPSMARLFSLWLTPGWQWLFTMIGSLH